MDAIRSWLYIGKYRETLDRELLINQGIQALLHLAAPIQHPEIRCLYLPVEDGMSLPVELLRLGINFVKDEYQQGHTLLIACGAGVSRSATFAVAALKEIEGLGLLEAIKEVQHHHRESLPHPALWESLCLYYQEEVPFLSMLRQLKGYLEA